jgi:hypothetical protein
LSKWFVAKPPPGPGPNTNVGETQPPVSSRIEDDATSNSGNVTGNYTWYRLFHFGGATNTQGREVRAYMIVFRDVSSTGNNPFFSINVPEGGYNMQFNIFKFLYNTFQTTDPSHAQTFITKSTELVLFKLSLLIQNQMSN